MEAQFVPPTQAQSFSDGTWIFMTYKNVVKFSTKNPSLFQMAQVFFSNNKKNV